MKSNYCTYCPMQTQCEYVKSDGIATDMLRLERNAITQKNKKMENLRKLWNMSCLQAGIPAITTDTAARIVAVVYVHGNNEGLTFNQKFIADLDYIQERFGIYGTGVPNGEFSALVKEYIQELEDFVEENKHLAKDRGVMFYDAKPQWALDLFLDNYNIKL